MPDEKRQSHEQIAETYLIAYTDGAARGNPGPAGAGVHITDEKGNLISEEMAWLGEATNNVAEYKALLLALEKLHELGATVVTIRADSELIVRQLKGEYRVKNKGLLPLFEKARNGLQSFKKFTIEHIPREANCEADRLANQAIDEAV